MKLDLMVCLGILLAVLFVGVVGAFLLYVPALTVLTVITLLLGLGLMFALGMLTGRRSRRSLIRASNLHVIR
jgi:cyanate permease